VQVIPQTENGLVSIAALEDILTEHNGAEALREQQATSKPPLARVKLIVLTWIPTNGGLVNPAEAVGRLAAQHHVLYLLDACQACGQMPVDVRRLKCHFLAATGRKFLRGPRGTGFLYVSSEALSEPGLLSEPASLDHTAASWVTPDRYEVHPSAQRYEQWEMNIAGFVGLNTALEYYLDVVEQEWAMSRICTLAQYLREELKGVNRFERAGTKSENLVVEETEEEQEVEESIVLTDLGTVESQCGLVSFFIRGVESEWAFDQLAAKNIYCSVTHPPSTLIDATNRKLAPLLRASVHYFNTYEEIDRFVHAVTALIPNASRGEVDESRIEASPLATTIG
jgi:selenocysteine lyase/cysteine desulfurase